MIVRWFRTGEVRSLSECQRLLGQYCSEAVSKSTLRDLLKRNNLVCRKLVFNTSLTKAAIKRRKLWAQEHLGWSVDQWRNVIFTDETYLRPFVFGMANKFKWVHTNDVASSNIIEIGNKYGRFKIGAWGAITSAGAGPLVTIETTMDTNKYIEVLRENLEVTASLLRIDKENILFQQDNAPYHKSNGALSYLQESGYKVLPWPPYSPDLSIIETVWANLQRDINNRSDEIRSKSDLIMVAKECFQAFDAKRLAPYYASIPNLVRKVHDAKGHLSVNSPACS